MQRPAVFLAFIFLATVAGAEEPGSGPLEGSKQELKSLQADQAAAKNGVATGKLSEGLPQLQSPVPGAVPLEILNPEKLDRDLKQRNVARKNWLLDGVDRLEKESRTGKAQGKNSPGDSSQADDEPQTTDRSDPDYLLKLYNEQKRGAGGQDKTGGLRHTAPRVDPMAPFLQNWLADSPVRGRFFDDFVKSPDSGGTPGTAADGASAFGAARSGLSGEPTGEARVSIVTRPSANPYLQAQDMPVLPDRTNASRGPAGSLGGVPPAAWTPALPAPAELKPVARPDEKTPPLLAPSDNQKYFPQQKKF